MNEQEANTSKSLIPLGDRGIELRTFDELFRFSGFITKAGFAPKNFDTQEKVFLALQLGMELGMRPMAALQNIAVINGRPGVYGEAALAIVQSHPDFEDMTVDEEGEGDGLSVTVTIKRRGRSPSVGSFSVKEAKSAELIGNPAKKDTWGKYPKRMLFWRAFHPAAKGAFSDALKGFKTVEELSDQDNGVGFENAKPANVVQPNFDNLPKRRGRPPKPAPAIEPLAEPQSAPGGQPESLEPYPEQAPATAKPEVPKQRKLPPAEEIAAQLTLEGISPQKFLLVMLDYGLTEGCSDPLEIEEGRYAIANLALKDCELALKNWPKILQELKAK